MHRAGRSFCTKQGYEIYPNNFGLLFSIPLRGVTFALHFLTLIIFVMPKMKTHSSAKKRFKVTGTGKVKRNRARMRHLMRKKTTKAKRHLRDAVVTHNADHARLERLLVI